MDQRNTKYHTVACKACGGEGGTAPVKRDSWGAKTSMRGWITCPECAGLGEIMPGYDPDGDCVCGMNNGSHSADCGGDDWLDADHDYYAD